MMTEIATLISYWNFIVVAWRREEEEEKKKTVPWLGHAVKMLVSRYSSLYAESMKRWREREELVDSRTFVPGIEIRFPRQFQDVHLHYAIIIEPAPNTVDNIIASGRAAAAILVVKAWETCEPGLPQKEISSNPFMHKDWIITHVGIGDPWTLPTCALVLNALVVFDCSTHDMPPMMCAMKRLSWYPNRRMWSGGRSPNWMHLPPMSHSDAPNWYKNFYHLFLRFQLLLHVLGTMLSTEISDCDYGQRRTGLAYLLGVVFLGYMCEDPDLYRSLIRHVQ